jgi:hypothetical protein
VTSIQNDIQLQAYIAANQIILNDGYSDLSKTESLNVASTVVTTSAPAFSTTLVTNGGSANSGFLVALDGYGKLDGRVISTDGAKLDGIAISAAALTSSAPIDTTKAAAVIGVAITAARSDHKHDVTTAAASSNPPGTSNAEGSATSLARSDHTHALAAYGTTSGTIAQGNDSRFTDARTPTAHSTSHKNGGTDEVATASATANAIPKAGAGGTLAVGWIPDLSATYATAAKGVTNGDSHDHNGGDGYQINHTTLSNIGTNTHAQIDTFIASKASASGLASLSASSLVVQNPSNATATATAST